LEKSPRELVENNKKGAHDSPEIDMFGEIKE
jgi:hypothetical protein